MASYDDDDDYDDVVVVVDDDDDVVVDDDDDDLDNVIAALDIQVLKCHGVSPQQLICILKKYETFKVIPVFLHSTVNTSYCS